MGEEDTVRLVVKTRFRRQMHQVMEHMHRIRDMSISEIIHELQLGTIFLYEQTKDRGADQPHEILEYQEVAVLELIAELGQEMALDS
jgi:hypothetical protein